MLRRRIALQWLRLARCVRRIEHQNAQNGRIPIHHQSQERHPISARHARIRQHHLELPSGQHFQGVTGLPRGGDVPHMLQCRQGLNVPGVFHDT